MGAVPSSPEAQHLLCQRRAGELVLQRKPLPPGSVCPARLATTGSHGKKQVYSLFSRTEQGVSQLGMEPADPDSIEHQQRGSPAKPNPMRGSSPERLHLEVGVGRQHPDGCLRGLCLPFQALSTCGRGATPWQCLAGEDVKSKAEAPRGTWRRQEGLISCMELAVVWTPASATAAALLEASLH